MCTVLDNEKSAFLNPGPEEELATKRSVGNNSTIAITRYHTVP